MTRAVTFPTFKHDPDDPVLMFKILVIQTINSLSHERTEYLINGQLRSCVSLGLSLSDRVPARQDAMAVPRAIHQSRCHRDPIRPTVKLTC